MTVSVSLTHRNPLDRVLDEVLPPPAHDPISQGVELTRFRVNKVPFRCRSRVGRGVTGGTNKPMSGSDHVKEFFPRIWGFCKVAVEVVEATSISPRFSEPQSHCDQRIEEC